MRTKYKHISKTMVMLLFTFAGAATMLTSCSDDITDSPSPDADDFVSTPVLLSAGNQALENATRAATTLYMPNKVRFSAAMYYQESAHYNLDPWLAFLQVDDEVAGNSKYRQYKFATPAQGMADNYGNDTEGTIFYWQNRQDHIFIGYIDNYNAAYASAKADGDQTYFPDKLDKHDDFPVIENQEVVRQQMCKHFDLRNPKDKKESELKEGETAWTRMADQYDPLIACTEKKPAGAGDETNRVYLTFKHQLSQIQVNLKGHESVNLIPAQIDAVEMLGVSESADIFPFVDYKADNTEPETQEGLESPLSSPNASIILYGGSYIRPAEAGKVDLTQYTDEQMEANPHGTSFDMFLADEPSTGYLKRFEAIAYGQLQALRIHWHELKNKVDAEGNDVKDADGNPIKEPGIDHIVTFAITDASFRELKSGKRYIINLEIRRGTLAIVRTVIDDWVPYETVYSEDGTINE